MSFGFAIGDFIAVGQLAQSLYKDVYLVARGAPEEVRILMSEIAIFSQSIDLLIEEVKNPTSTLVQSGESRVMMVNEMMKQANATLKDLEKFAKKYELGDKEGGKAKIKRTWDKLRFAREKSSIDELRAKIQYHNGAMNLLLTAAGNSSLERMENFNKQMEDSIGNIQAMLGESAQIPILSSIEGKKFQMTLSQAFLKEAERVRPWRATGLDEWIKAGRWWLMKSQARLYSYNSTTLIIPTQTYADLLKASWILIDIISKHPQQRFWSPTSEYLQPQLLVEKLKSELEAIKRLGLEKPGIDEIEQADLRIWLEVPLAVSLHPKADDEVKIQGSGSWQTFKEEIYFQGFGLYQTDSGSLQIECMILVLINKSCDRGRLVVQTQKGIDLLDIQIHVEFLQEVHMRILESKNGLILRDGQVLLFHSNDDFIILNAILNSIVYYFQQTEIGMRDHKALNGFVLLLVIDSGAYGAIQHVFNGRRNFSQAEEMASFNCTSSFADIWSLAAGVAAIVLNNGDDESGQLIRSNPRLMPPGSPLYIDVYDWFYRLLKAPATVLKSSWIHILSPFEERFRPVSLMHAALYMAVWRGSATIVKAVVIGISDWNLKYDCIKHDDLLRLDIGYEPITRESHTITALELATTCGDATIVQLLLDHELESRASVTCRTKALHISATAGHVSILRYLLDHSIDLEGRDCKSRAALHLAASEGHEIVTRLLLEKGACVRLTTDNGSTPLHMAVYNGHGLNSNFNIPGVPPGSELACPEWTAYKDNARGDYIGVVRLLLDYGAQPAAKTSWGLTPLHIAAYMGTSEVIQLLLEKGANIEEKMSNGMTPLDLAVSNGNEETVRLLLKNGAKVLSSVIPKQTAVHHAAWFGHESILRLLLENGVDDLEVNRIGLAAIYYAAGFGHTAVVRLLIEKGASVNERRSLDFKTPLHCAVEGENESVVRLLLENGADSSIEDDSGNTALSLTKEKGNKGVVHLLTQSLVRE